MIDTPKIIQTELQLTAVIHLTVARSEITRVMGPAIAEILAALAAQQLTPAGPCFSYHLRRPSEVFDFEVGFPVKAPITPNGRVKLSQLPATKVAQTIYRGGYDGLGAAWGELMAWINAQAGLVEQESLWECYLIGPESSPDPAQWCTQLHRPLR
jgi:effector-binding domain-containing protein